MRSPHAARWPMTIHNTQKDEVVTGVQLNFSGNIATETMSRIEKDHTMDRKKGRKGKRVRRGEKTGVKI